MKKMLLTLLTVATSLTVAASDFLVRGLPSFTPEHPLTLWYNQPATTTGVDNPWMEYSLPIGNGQLGASLFGGVEKDEIQFNEKTLWTGSSADMGSYGQYKNFGSVFVEDISEVFGQKATSAVMNYCRYLDIQNGTAGVTYSSANKSAYERTYLSSYPDKVIAVRYKVTGANRMSLRFTLVPGEDINATSQVLSEVSATPGDFRVKGQLTTVCYQACLRIVLPSEGTKTVNANEKTVTVEGADEVVLYLSAATNYDDDPGNTMCASGTAADVQKTVLERVANAEAKGFDAILADHIRDFESLMGRVELQLGKAAPRKTRTTDKLITYYNGLSNLDNDEARFLEQLYFAYGRYLEISSSRGVNVPSNLQGIWNNLSKAPWNSDIHTNINVQMNYWPAEPTNLSEMHLPFLNFIIKMAQQTNYKRAATQYGGVKNGWTVFTESNIFGGMSTWGSNYFVANAWYCSHLWQHFRYTRDEEFLARAFPAMWSCAQFWFERMIEDRGYDSSTQNSGYRGTAYKVSPDGTYVAPNEYSAEQNAHNSEDGTAHAQQLIYALFESVRDAYQILGPAVTGLTTEDIEKLNLYLEKTDKGLHTETYTANSALNSGWSNPRNGVKKGDVILREWKYSPYDVSDDPSHRHMSHLMALYPLTQIAPSSEYFLPAVNSLKLRGDAATGWSMGWKVNLWARALDGDHAHIILKNALKHSTAYGTNQYAGGVYYNLYDAHAPFQIDGNFGVCAGIAEMLLQSHTDTLQLLPALPTTWPEGHINGLKAVGNFEVDQTWKDGKISAVVIRSHAGRECAVKYPGVAGHAVYCNGVQIACTIIDANTISFATERGKTYEIDYGNLTKVAGAKKKSALISRVRRENNILTVEGGGIRQVKAYDAAGRQLARTTDYSFRAVPGTVIVQAWGKDGDVETRKCR